MLFLNELCVEVTPRELGLERLIELLPHRRKAYGRDPERRLVGLIIDEARPVRPQTAQGLRGMVPDDTGADTNGALITSTCLSPTLGRQIGLGYVPWESRYPGTRVTAGAMRATVARLPFYDPAKRLVRDGAQAFA
jgi:glycine cleavage system aminomethyltransferase T